MVSNQDTPSYFSRASALINTIIQKQSTSVDTVSGATYSSRGIIEAVRNALKRAAGQEVSDNFAGSSGTTGGSGSVSIAVSETPQEMADGTYTGSGQGFGGVTTVSVTISGGKIASVEVTGKSSYRSSLVSNQSARLICGYIYASIGEGESSQDLVFGGHNMIAENGAMLASSPRFTTGILYGELDIRRLRAERRRMTTYDSVWPQHGTEAYIRTPFTLELEETELTRSFDPKPFVPSGKSDRDKRCEEILTIQALGLKKRLEHINCHHIVVGISGGLDSTLALLVMVKAFDMLGLSHENIIAVTMPCFGTTSRTYNNACLMTRTLGRISPMKTARRGNAPRS